jgi:hypothetical protein
MGRAMMLFYTEISAGAMEMNDAEIIGWCKKYSARGGVV